VRSFRTLRNDLKSEMRYKNTFHNTGIQDKLFFGIFCAICCHQFIDQ